MGDLDAAGLAKRETQKPWGAGLITWHASREALELILSYKPHAVMLSFGDPAPFIAAIKASGAKLILQVQTVAEACAAKNSGADLIIAQGSEAGGHGATRATLPLVPAIVDAVHPLPVLAAGGIVDGRGVAAAFMLGAEGALIGTAFCATDEAIMHPKARQRLVDGSGDDTVRTRVCDIVRGYDWPARYTGRTLRNRFTQRWHGREQQLEAALKTEQTAYNAAREAGDFDDAVVWAGEGVDLIRGVSRAGELTQRIMADAETCLKGAATRLGAR